MPKAFYWEEKNAATNYFKQKTSVQLANAFSPHIKGKLDEVNATKTLDRHYHSLQPDPLHQ